MQISAYVASVVRVSESQVDLTVNIGFVLSGTNHNIQAAPLTGIGSLTDALLCNSAIATAVSDYVDTNYGTSTTGANVSVFGGAVLPISL